MTSRELESKIKFPQQSILSAGRKLKKHGFIKTVKGPFGGYILAKPAGKITIQEILEAYKDGFNISGETTCMKPALPALQHYIKMLTDIKDEINEKFSFTLADLQEEK